LVILNAINGLTIQFLAFINFSHGHVHFVQAARFLYKLHGDIHQASIAEVWMHTMTGFTKAI